MRFTVAWRYRVLAVLCLTSVVAWALGGWAAETAASDAMTASGNPVRATLVGYGVGLELTWAWLVGAALMHTIVAAIGVRRRDREVLAGVAWSVVVHAAWMVGQGVLQV